MFLARFRSSFALWIHIHVNPECDSNTCESIHVNPEIHIHVNPEYERATKSSKEHVRTEFISNYGYKMESENNKMNKLCGIL
ncbi:hypothetical protein GJ496_001256 [Pomphorhynchus laevis]|nr:hypothetical protein GJ496_001256 [Pomphorhynchus laevis]